MNDVHRPEDMPLSWPRIRGRAWVGRSDKPVHGISLFVIKLFGALTASQMVVTVRLLSDLCAGLERLEPLGHTAVRKCFAILDGGKAISALLDL